MTHRLSLGYQFDVWLVGLRLQGALVRQFGLRTKPSGGGGYGKASQPQLDYLV